MSNFFIYFLIQNVSAITYEEIHPKPVEIHPVENRRNEEMYTMCKFLQSHQARGEEARLMHEPCQFCALPRAEI